MKHAALFTAGGVVAAAAVATAVALVVPALVSAPPVRLAAPVATSTPHPTKVQAAPAVPAVATDPTTTPAPTPAPSDRTSSRGSAAPAHVQPAGGAVGSSPGSVDVDPTARTLTVSSPRVTLAVDYSSGVRLTSLSVDGRSVADAAGSTPSAFRQADGTTVTSAAATDATASSAGGATTLAFSVPLAAGSVAESWTFDVVGASVRWSIARTYHLAGATALTPTTGAITWGADTWENVRRPADGGNIPVGGAALDAASDVFTAHDALGRNGILLERAPNHAVFDTSRLVYLTHGSAVGLSVTASSTGTVAALLAREGTPAARGGLTGGWRLTSGETPYANGNPKGYKGRFSEVAGQELLAPSTYSDGATEQAAFTVTPVATADYYGSDQLAGFDDAALRNLIGDFGRTIVQGATIGASSERSFRAGEAPGFTSPWNVWSLELLQDPGAFASMRGQFDDIFAEPKRNPDDINAPVGGRLGGLQDTTGRLHCCDPYGKLLDDAQPTYETTDNTLNAVFSVATLYNLDPDKAWLSGLKDSVRLALGYAENDLLIRSGPTAGLFANARCADPQSPTGCFTDWSEWNDQYDIGQVSAYQNVFAYGALTRWAELERNVLGDTARADHDDQLAANLKAAYNRAAADGGFWSPATTSFAYTRDASGAIAKDCSNLFANGYASMLGLVDGQRELSSALAVSGRYGTLEQTGYVYDHGAQGGTDFTWKLPGSSAADCASGEKLDDGVTPRMYFPFFEDGGVHLLNVQAYAPLATATGDASTLVDQARTVVERYTQDGFLGWSNIQPDTLQPRRDIWQEPFMVNNVLGVWPLYHDVLGFQPAYDRLDIAPAIDASLVGSHVTYRLRGTQDVAVTYNGVADYTVTTSGTTPIHVGWARVAGEQYTVTVDGTARTVTAGADGMVRVDGLPSGTHRYALTGAAPRTEDDTAVQFSSQWWAAPGDGFLGGSLRGTSAAGATARVDFTGTGIDVLGSVGADKGRAAVSIDGHDLPDADWYSATSANGARTVSVRGLAPGAHVLTLTVLGTHSAGAQGDQVTVDAVTVIGGATTPPDPAAGAETAVPAAQLTYSSGWWAVGDPAFRFGQLRGSSQAGASAELTFTGTGFALSGSIGGDKGIAVVTVDGVEVGRPDWYADTPANQRRVFELDGLAPGTHILRVVVAGEHGSASVGDQVNLDAVLVRTGT
ncbi:hypothetical protein [Leifsonia sp. TF02-11]|uniref:hypothetical protein n=1 Tax=Leifsonia sp. TF02-11 TaxID=2815212 RepID=UPI001AA0E7D7|nr:hypothetical protein [Leifsonia sp. TF02-11]MBO1739200.1 hypothetical protein [Leifsonia sp. TF02-11]